MKFVENFIAIELNISLDNLETVNLQKNIDGWYILSSNCLIGTYHLRYAYDVDINFEYTQIFELNSEDTLIYLDECDSTIDLDYDEEENLKENLKNICNYIREYLEN